MDGARRLEPELEWIRAGIGFYRIMGDDRPEEAHRQAAAEGLATAREKITGGEYSLVILDEINVAIHEGLVDVKDVLAMLDHKPEAIHVILTGRNAPAALLEKADLVTEMKEIKHPFQEGMLAQKGFDY